MSEDCKTEVINNILMVCCEVTDNIVELKNILYMQLAGYEVTKKSTEIVEYKGDENEKLIQKFIISKKIKGLTDRSLHYYNTELHRILEQIQKPVLNITTDDIRYYLAVRKMRDQVTDVTMDNELRILRTFFQWLQVEEIQLKNPTSRIDSIKSAKKQKEAFTEMEVARLRDGCRNAKERAVIEIFLSTGCRVTELVQIKRNEIQDNVILIHGKGRKDRNVYLNAQALLALKKYLDERKDHSEYLFPKSVSVSQCPQMRKVKGRYYQYPDLLVPEEHQAASSIESMIRKLGKKLGIKAYPHKFRRTCATFALRSGMPIEQVSKMLGHEQIGTTQRYLDLKESELKAAHEKYVR